MEDTGLPLIICRAMSKSVYYTDKGATCWSCTGTAAEYTTDDTVSLIEVQCLICGRRDVFTPPPGVTPRTADDIAAAHRGES